ncbi:alternate-type signal peptide domain-containing protein [Arthrobacter sp. NPDC093125]|uniref:alternate-type signal peptide domain-containing protein n=1 Tax=Arthrobacter sp. NPDC093125 TaxID=3363944 RepID=UPI00382EAEDF
MNKAIKGAIAAGAAGMLLLGGAGTFATWRDSATVDASTVSTGQLSLSAAEGKWTETAAPLVPIDPETFQIVPGDSITYTTTVTVKAEGENLKAVLAVPETLAAEVTNDVDPSETVVPEELLVTMNIDEDGVNGLGVSPDDDLTEANNVLTFADEKTYTIPVTITVNFPLGTASTQDQNLNVDLTKALAFTLQQK